MNAMNAKDNEWSAEELGISLTDVILVENECLEPFDDNYVRSIEGDVWIVGEVRQKTTIGSVELTYFDASRALDNRFDIVEIADWIGDNAREIAEAMYTNGMLSQELFEEVLSSDLLAVDSISILPEYRGRNYELRIARKLADTVGRRCGAIVIRSEVLTEAGIAPKSSNALHLKPTKNPGIYRIGRV